MTTTKDQSLPFHVTVRRNDGPQKFYSGAADLATAEAIAADRNAKEADLRRVRAAERAQPIERCDLYVYEVQAR